MSLSQKISLPSGLQGRCMNSFCDYWGPDLYMIENIEDDSSQLELPLSGIVSKAVKSGKWRELCKACAIENDKDIKDWESKNEEM